MIDHTPMTAGKFIPPRITAVLENLRRVYGEKLVLKSVTSEGAVFSVQHLTDVQLIKDLMQQKHAVFGAASLAAETTGPSCVLGPRDFQVLCAQTPKSVGDGIHLKYMPAIPDRQDYLAGFWFY